MNENKAIHLCLHHIQDEDGLADMIEKWEIVGTTMDVQVVEPEYCEMCELERA